MNSGKNLTEFFRENSDKWINKTQFVRNKGTTEGIRKLYTLSKFETVTQNRLKSIVYPVTIQKRDT